MRKIAEEKQMAGGKKVNDTKKQTHVGRGGGGGGI
jgi:hypothetical protein